MEELEVAVAKTLVMDCTWRGKRTHLDPSFLDSFKAFQRLYGKGIDETTPQGAKIHSSGFFRWVWDFDEEEEATLRRDSWPFEVALQEAHKGRRFCLTGNKYMCTAPYNAERGDVVVLLEGFRTPFVFRQEGDYWRVVGDCYVHGTMDGELIVPLEGLGAIPNETSMDTNRRLYAIRTARGLVNSQEFRVR